MWQKCTALLYHTMIRDKLHTVVFFITYYRLTSYPPPLVYPIKLIIASTLSAC